MTNTMQQTVVIADYDYGDVNIERAIIEDAGLRLVAAQCKTEDDVIEAARDADAIIAQYATVGARATLSTVPSVAPDRIPAPDATKMAFILGSVDRYPCEPVVPSLATTSASPVASPLTA